jgi:arylsulfatase A
MIVASAWALVSPLLPTQGAIAEAPAAGSESPRPNIVLVLADDLGYGDLACFGAKDIRTPHLDKLAAQGMRFTSCYAGHANCSPSRTALMTGRTPTRVGVRNWIPQDSPMHVRKSEITIASLLKQAGYDTCHVGKWHMNGHFNQPTQPQPGDHGFNHWFSTQNNASPSHHNPDNFVRNGEALGLLEGYASHIVADEALRWLQNGRDPKRPFFLFVCFHEPHEPIATDPRYTALYPSDDPTYSAHHGNITQMDEAFGHVMHALDRYGLADETLVFFTSDNGPAITRMHPHGSPGPLRDKKSSLHEGGIRVPGILRWPGHAKPGSTSDEPICGVDFLPTVCEIAGIHPPADRALDGASLLPTLRGDPIKRTTPLYWHFTQASSEGKVAIRIGDWKLLATLDRKPAGGTDITPEGERAFKEAELDKFSLYNLREDIGETTDLAAREPDKLAELKALLTAKYREVRDASPAWPAWTAGGAKDPQRSRQGQAIKRKQQGKKAAKTG